MPTYDGRSLGLAQDPFVERADPVFLYTGMERRALYHSLLDRLVLSGGLFLLTGGKGSGKTLLTARLAHELRARGALVVMASAADAAPPLSSLSQALGVPEPGDDVTGWAAAIRRAVAMHEDADRNVVFIVDDAQALGGSEIAALRLLLGRSEPLRLALVARPEIGDDLAPALQADLAQALTLHCALGPMSDEEIGSLVWHRLRRAGCRRAELFSEDAITAVAAYAAGMPGRAVRLCAATLRRAVAESSTMINGALVREAARTLPPDLEDRKARPAAPRWYEPRQSRATAPARRRSLTTKLAVAVGCLVGIALATAGFVIVATPESVRSATLLQGFSATAPKPAAAVAPVVVAVEPARPADERRIASMPMASTPAEAPLTVLPPLVAERPPAAALARSVPPPSAIPSALETRQVAEAATSPSVEAQRGEGTSTAPEPDSAARATSAEPAPPSSGGEADQAAETPKVQDPAAASPPVETATPVDAASSQPAGEPQQATETPAAPSPAPEPPPVETAAPAAAQPPTEASGATQAVEAPTVPAPQPTESADSAPAGNGAAPLSGTTEATQPSGGENPAASASESGDARVEMVGMLMTRGARQVAAGQITNPPDDNALTTYREILLIAPDGNAGPKLLESIRAHYRDKARAAESAGNSAEAQRLEAVARDPLSAAAEETGTGASEQAASPAPPASSDERPDARAAAAVSPAPSAGASVQVGSPAPPTPPTEERTNATAAAAPSLVPGAGATEQAGTAAPPAAPPDGRTSAAAAPSPPVPSAGATQAPVARAPTLSNEMIAALMKRGEAMLAVGDISAARLLYERAAEAGNAKAATAVGKTYDPAFLRQIAARGVAPQPERAAEWYRRALEAGDTEAGARLSALGETRR
jgi:type II secretory pathway predicted ATPase ExeA